MKKTATLLALICTLFVHSQTNVVTTLHDVQPDSICQGDTISVYFTLALNQPGTYTNTAFKMHFINASTFIWQGHYSGLTGLPQQQNSGNLCYVLKLKSPVGYPTGPAFVESNGSMDYTEYMQCLSSVGINDNLPADVQTPAKYFTLDGVQLDHAPPAVLLIEQRGLNRKKIIINE